MEDRSIDDWSTMGDEENRDGFPFRWTYKKLKNLERIQESLVGMKPLDSGACMNVHQHNKRTFNSYPRTPRHRARAAMGINENPETNR